MYKVKLPDGGVYCVLKDTVAVLGFPAHVTGIA
jgi:hypothetical protein